MFSGPLEDKSEPEQCSCLMLWVGEKGRTIFSTWKLSEWENRRKIKKYVDKFKGNVKPISNVIFSRYKCHIKIQETGVSLEQFTTQLKILVKDCNYDKSDEMDRIVIGVRNQKFREKRIRVGSELQLEIALEIARTHELSLAKSMAGEDPLVKYVHKGNPHTHRKSFTKSDREKKQLKHKFIDSKEDKLSTFTRCGYKHEGNPCQALGQTCNKCHKINHFAQVCRTKFNKSKSKSVRLIEEEDYSDSSDTQGKNTFLFMGSLDFDIKDKNRWTTELNVGEHNLRT